MMKNENKLESLLIEELQDQRNVQESTYWDEQMLNKLLLDSLPHPAMLINKKRIVLAANKVALEMGVKIGDYCWKEFGKCEYLSDKDKKLAELNPHTPGIQCTFCLADKAMNGGGKTQNDPKVAAFDRLWDTYWVPLNDDIFLHYAIDITERRKMEEALYESEKKLKEAQRVARVGSWELDLMQNKLWWSNEVYRIFELEPQEFEATYEAFLSNVHPDDYDFVNEVYTNSVHNRVPYDIVHRLQMKDGRIKYVNMRCETKYDASGKALRSIGTVLDITQLKQSEFALRQSEEKFRSVIEQSGEGITLADSDGNYTTINPAFCKMTGYSEAELLTMNVRDLLPPGTKLFLFPKVMKGQTGRRETELVKKDGSRFPSEINGYPINLDDKKLVMGTVRDITERKKLDNEKTMLAYAVKSIRECVSVTDTEDNIIFVNDAFLKTYGYKRSELIGKPIEIVRSANNPPEVMREILPKTLQGGWTGEIMNRKKDGTEFPVSLSSSVIQSNNGHPDALIGVTIDITKRKQLEEQLQQSQKLEAIGQLAGGVAHDFNNLLTVINGYSSILLDKLDEDDKMYKDIQQIALAGERAGSLTEQLLAFSRKQIIQPDILNLNHIVQETEKILRRLIGEDIALQTRLEENIGYIKADSGQMNQIIINLVVNARDAMPDGGQLTIETDIFEIDVEYRSGHLKVQPGKYVVLSISDNGIGMDEQTKSRIFEPFFTTKGIGKGTGLGLSTVYGIVKQNGGYIWVYSVAGKGTTFKIYLPQIEGEAVVKKQKESSLETLYGTETILLVEDEYEVCQLTAEILQSSGYQVLQASHGVEAMAVANKYSDAINLLLTDVVMPKMSGKKLSENLKKLYPGLKVVFISGYTNEAISRSGILNKGTVFMQKPFSPRALLSLIRKTLDSV